MMAISTSQWQAQASRQFYIQLFFMICASFAVRVAVSLWTHSGEGKPPMYGDLEAQRHWMEITVNLPVGDWYVDTKDNDLQYWGLDYPPLTAYHMMANGHVARLVNPDMVALQSSHGMENKDVKIFMRATVLLMDMLVFIPVAAAYFILLRKRDETDIDVLLSIFVLIGYPGIILIDNGHFQYNNISLGLFVLATITLSLGYDLIGAAIFCLALNYKQMELYHATPFFFYLLGLCLKSSISKGLFKLMTLGLVVIITFITVWSPFLHSKTTTLSVLQRIFPVNRGLYEDKVANVWCSLSVVIKLKQLLPHSAMASVCLVTTLLALIPSSIHLLRNPTMRNFNYAVINSSLVFFLLSFHVHEKSILLAAIPVCLIVKTDPFYVVWFLLISVFSMLPLLIKDGIIIPTVALCGIFWMIGLHYFNLFKGIQDMVKLMFYSSMMMAVSLGIATVTIPSPSRYPDIFPLAISVYSCGHFVLFVVYFHFKQFNWSLNLEKRGHDEKNTRSQRSETAVEFNPGDKMNLRKRKTHR